MGKVKCEFIVLGVSTQRYVTRTGIKKETHEFKRLDSFNSLDSVISYCLFAPYVRFRVVRRANKKFLPTLNCVKVCNSLIFC